MTTTRQQQRAEARVWRQLAEAVAVKLDGWGLCYALRHLKGTRTLVYQTIYQTVRDQGRIVWIDDNRVLGPDWDRCLFACLMAAVAEAGDMDVYRGEEEYV